MLSVLAAHPPTGIYTALGAHLYCTWCTCSLGCWIEVIRGICYVKGCHSIKPSHICTAPAAIGPFTVGVTCHVGRCAERPAPGHYLPHAVHSSYSKPFCMKFGLQQACPGPRPVQLVSGLGGQGGAAACPEAGSPCSMSSRAMVPPQAPQQVKQPGKALYYGCFSSYAC